MSYKGGVLHWTAGKHLPNEIDKKHYHGGILLYNDLVFYQKWHDYSNIINHCWRRNTDYIGITVCGMFQASAYNWGRFPIIEEQIEELCLVSAEIAFLKGFDSSLWKTHAEMAVLDNYFGERWDLARLNEGAITPDLAKITGDILRRKIHNYKLEIYNKERTVRDKHYKIVV